MRRGLLVVLLLTLPSGCGASSPPSAQLHDQATRICQPATRRLKRIPTPRPGDYEGFLRHGLAVLQPQLARLRSLRPQGDERDVFAGALDALSQEITAVKGAAQSLGRHQDPRLVFAALERRLSPLEAQADAAWRALQIPACLSR